MEFSRLHYVSKDRELTSEQPAQCIFLISSWGQLILKCRNLPLEEVTLPEGLELMLAYGFLFLGSED